MSSGFMTAYLLVWPLIVAVILGVIATGFFKEFKKARDSGKSMI